MNFNCKTWQNKVDFSSLFADGFIYTISKKKKPRIAENKYALFSRDLVLTMKQLVLLQEVMGFYVLFFFCSASESTVHLFLFCHSILKDICINDVYSKKNNDKKWFLSELLEAGNLGFKPFLDYQSEKD